MTTMQRDVRFTPNRDRNSRPATQISVLRYRTSLQRDCSHVIS